MYWINPFWIKPFASFFTWVITQVEADYLYNNYQLKNDNIIITKDNFDNSHDIQSDYFDRPLADGGVQENYFFRKKNVRLDGYIKADTPEELNIAIDNLKWAILQSNKKLQIKVNWVIREANASLINGSSLFSREYFHLTFIPFSLEFRALEKFKEIKRVSNSILNQTATLIAAQYNFGTATALPVFTISFNSASWVNNIAIELWDSEIIITESISSSDVLIIDCDNKTITLNGSEVDYLWVFPELMVWDNTYTITTNGTYDYNMTIYYFNTYL